MRTGTRPGLRPVEPQQEQLPGVDAKLEITSFRTLTGAGNLRALVSVRIVKTVVHDFRVVQQTGQRAFVQPPIRTWIDNKIGKVCYGGPLVELPFQAFQAVSQVILERWETMLIEGDR